MATTRQQPDLLFQQILAEFKGMNSELATIRGEMEAFKQALEPITRIVRGDGIVQSLGTQIELLKQDLVRTNRTDTLVQTHTTEIELIKRGITSLVSDLGDSDVKIKELEDRADISDREDKKGRWTVIAAFVTGIMALVGAIVLAIVSSVKK